MMNPDGGNVLFFLILELSILLGFLLDLLLADPAGIPHPVVIIGRGISFLEKHLRAIFPDNPGGRRAAGRVLAVLIPLTTLILTCGLCFLAWVIHPLLFFGLHTLWCWQAIAIRGLEKEAKNVWRALTGEGEQRDAGRGADSGGGDEDKSGAEVMDDPDACSGRLIRARKAVGRIVGRDTDRLDEKGVIRATVETVAENFSDGVMAPFFYMMIGGAPLALVYKSINTMDSMVGYKNEKYIDFGRSAARLDDAAGFLPARLGAVLWIASASLGAGGRGNELPSRPGKNALRIWKRDRRNHASPNAAQTESACAGALGVQLAGPAWYFGEFYDKPAIGDDDRPIGARDILRTNRMMLCASVLGLLLVMAVLAAWMIPVFGI